MSASDSSLRPINGDRLTINHLLPSSSFFPSFRDGTPPLVRMLSGLGFVSGLGLLLLSETALPVRREGFLCVISLRSTFRRPEVTDSPLLSCSKTAPMSPEAALFGLTPGGDGKESRLGSGGGGGGGGGPPAAPGGGGAGGGAPLTAGDGASDCFRASDNSTPLLFQVKPAA